MVRKADLYGTVEASVDAICSGDFVERVGLDRSGRLPR
jgi:hypothetical protein